MADIELGFSLFDWVLGKLPAWIVAYIPQVLRDRLRPLANDWQSQGEKRLSTLVEPILAPLKPAIHVLTHLRDSTIGFLDKFRHLAESILEEYNAIKHFKEDTHWRGRVVNAPQVVKKIKRLANIPAEVASKLRDLAKRIADQVPGGRPVGELAGEAAESLDGIEDFRGAITKFAPKLAKGAERVLGILAIAVDILIAWNAALDDLQTVVDDVKEVRLDIEKLDLIFLPQNNARRYVKLEDGRTIRIRIGGHLHPK